MNDYAKREEKSLCYGCRACEQACPKSCISMVLDNEGFLYPATNKELCNNCKVCLKVCPIGKDLSSNYRNEYYATYHKDNYVRVNSSSGGAFTAIVETFCDNNWVAFGAGYDEEFNVNHSFAQSKEDIGKFRKSKYVQSDIGNCYSKAKEFLESGKKVLFSGTSCQIAGLRTFLGKNYPSLLTCDILCHGTPSPAVFHKYITDMQVKFKSNLKSIDFRHKKDGHWKKLYIRLLFENGQEYLKKHSEDPYGLIYSHRLAHRPVCHVCPFASSKRIADITIADFWGIEKFNKYISYTEGVSLVIVNTPKGHEILDKAKIQIHVKTECYEHAATKNSTLIEPAPLNPRRFQFFQDKDRFPIDELADKHVVRRNVVIRFLASFLSHNTKKKIRKYLNI